jgi:hypothetical protein
MTLPVDCDIHPTDHPHRQYDLDPFAAGLLAAPRDGIASDTSLVFSSALTAAPGEPRRIACAAYPGPAGDSDIAQELRRHVPRSCGAYRNHGRLPRVPRGAGSGEAVRALPDG